MKKKKENLVPIPPKELVSVTPRAAENLKRWIEYLKGLSSRVKITTPQDEDFDLSYFEKKARIIGDLMDNDKFADWPSVDQVAFILYYDSALPGQKPEFLAKNMKVFCFYNLAFGLDYFEVDEIDDEENPKSNVFSLTGFSEVALSWVYISNIVRERLEKIEKSVNRPPLV